MFIFFGPLCNTQTNWHSKSCMTVEKYQHTHIYVLDVNCFNNTLQNDLYLLLKWKSIKLCFSAGHWIFKENMENRGLFFWLLSFTFKGSLRGRRGWGWFWPRKEVAVKNKSVSLRSRASEDSQSKRHGLWYQKWK